MYSKKVITKVNNYTFSLAKITDAAGVALMAYLRLILEFWPLYRVCFNLDNFGIVLGLCLRVMLQITLLSLSCHSNNDKASKIITSLVIYQY